MCHAIFVLLKGLVSKFHFIGCAGFVYFFLFSALSRVMQNA